MYELDEFKLTLFLASVIMLPLGFLMHGFTGVALAFVIAFVCTVLSILGGE